MNLVGTRWGWGGAGRVLHESILWDPRPRTPTFVDARGGVGLILIFIDIECLFRAYCEYAWLWGLSFHNSR